MPQIPMPKVDCQKLLHQLMDEIATFDERLYQPDKEMQDDDTLVCYASVGLRKLYAYRMHCKRRSLELAVELKFCSELDKPAFRQLRDAEFRARNIAEIVNRLFWLAAEEEMGSNGDDRSPGIRTGWRLVLHPGHGRNLADFLSELL